MQYGKRVWGLSGESDIEIAEKAIEMTVTFFQSLGIDTKLSDYTDDYKDTAQTVSDRFTERNG